jgi:hypothetical protein
MKSFRATRVTSLIVALLTAFSVGTHARTNFDPGDSIYTAAAAPSYCQAIHQIGKMAMTVNNNGTIGTGYSKGAQDCFTGDLLQSCEYPKGSRTTYLFAGLFWIGAVVGRDTLVSTGGDGWLQGGNEFHPDVPPVGDMIYRSIVDPSSTTFEGAVSEEDFISVYYDTCSRDCAGLGRDVIDGRSHRPLNLEVVERSFAWSYAYAESFVLFDYAVKNIGVNRLKRVYMGIYVDADVLPQNNPNGFADDVCGFRQSLPAFYSTSRCEWEDTINIAWIADNDGDLSAQPPIPNVTGTRIVRTPSDSLDVSFNWWVSNGSAPLDFGPRRRTDSRDLSTGGNGTPTGDRNKYWFLRNGEFDYDQVYTADIEPTDTIWQYPNQNLAGDIADGFDTRYLLSFGPFDIEPGQVLPISFSYVGGQKFHSKLDNIGNLPNNPDEYYQNIDFSDLGYNSIWSSWVYDNPGYDTDTDGFAGVYHICNASNDSTCCWIDTTYDTISTNPPVVDTVVDSGYIFTLADTVWYQGDGIPDFKGASPPPAPEVRVYPTVGKILVKFNGLRSESTRDVFSRVFDFEGYRVYLARDDRRSSYSILASYDRLDFSKYYWDASQGITGDWVLKDAPFSLEQLRCLYAAGGCNDSTFRPLDYTRANPFKPTGFPDSLFFFVPQDYNQSEFGVSTDIRKTYPNQPYPVSLDKDSCAADDTTSEGYFKYFEYEYEIPELLATVPYYINVTAFDFGSPKSGLASLESSPNVNPQITYALATAEEVEQKDLKVYTYPNPYRIDGNYRASGFEGRGDINRPDDRLRAIHFVNLPAKCTIRIYTIDGDLVREISHDMNPADPLASHDTWDLITRNTQLAVSGLYYWTVEEPDGQVQIGKLVLIM